MYLLGKQLHEHQAQLVHHQLMLEIGEDIVVLFRGPLMISLASVARKLCTTLVDPKGLEAFVAGRLIVLNKKPGVRPIGVGGNLLKDRWESSFVCH